MLPFYSFKKNISIIKTASERKVKHVFCAPNKLTIQVLDLLWNKGFISGYRLLKKPGCSLGFVQVFLKYSRSKSVLQGLKVIWKGSFVSSFSWKTIILMKFNYSLVLISTSKGLLSQEECLKYRLGGVLLVVCN